MLADRALIFEMELLSIEPSATAAPEATAPEATPPK
jgi:hypothetical protein